MRVAGSSMPNIGPVTNTDQVLEMIDVGARSIARFFSGEIIQDYVWQEEN